MEGPITPNLPDNERVRKAAAKFTPEALAELLADPAVAEDLALLTTVRPSLRPAVWKRLAQRGLYEYDKSSEDKPSPPILDSKGRPYSQGMPPTPRARPTLITELIDDIEEREWTWLWPGRIPYGTSTLVLGRMGDGKSTLTSWLAATVSAGLPWPDCPDDNEPGSVLILQAEESASKALKRRLRLFGNAKGKIHVVRGINRGDDKKSWFSLVRDCEALEAKCDEIGDVKLIMIDPLDAYMQGISGYNGIETRSYLQPLSDLADERDVAVVLITHPNKNKDNEILDRISGAGAFGQVVRSSWYLSRFPSDKSKRLLSHMKSNVIGITKTAIAFTYDENRGKYTWFSDPIDMDAEDVNNVLQREARDAKFGVKRGPDPTEANRAVEFILGYLTNGPCLQSVAQDQALNVGIKESSFLKGLKHLRVTDGRVRRERGEADKRWWLHLVTPTIDAETCDRERTDTPESEPGDEGSPSDPVNRAPEP
jgi:putative DNA primase/helicase